MGENQNTKVVGVPILSIYRNSHDTHGTTVTLQAVRERILDGKRGLDKKTRYCNALVITEPDKYRGYKEENLPAVTFSGTFPKGKRKAQHLAVHSGLVTIDIDGLLPSQMPQLLAELAQMPHVVLAFVSPSGLGIKVIVSVDPIPTNDLEHKGAYQACLDFFENLAEEYSFEIDTSGKDCSRLCYLAHDPLAIFHTDTPAIEWDKHVWITEQKEKQERFEAEAKKAYTGEADVKALDFIDPNDLDYNQWLSVLTACKHAGLSMAQTDAWSRRGGVRYTEGEVENRWHGLHLDVSWGAVVNLAKLNGYIPLHRNRKPVRLKQKTDLDCILEPLEKSRERLKEAFEKDYRFIGVRADTGVGKNYKAQIYFLNGYPGYVSTPSTGLAKEQHARFRSLGINSFRWRGVASDPNGEFPHEKPCQFPDEYNALSEKGRNPVKALCDNCPLRAECDEYGYRSQEEEAKKYDVIVGAHKDLLMNPTYRKVAERVLPSDKDGLTVVDEFDIIDSFNKVEITQSRLETLRDMWHDTPLGTFAKQILDACVVQNDAFTGVSYAIEMLADYERDEIIQRLGQLRTEDGAILDADQLQDYEKKSGQTSSLENIKKLPMLEPDAEWNMLTKLELFFETYHHAETAPIEWKDNTLTFHVPPLPMFTKCRVIMMSATLNETFFRQVFRARQEKRGDVEFLDLVNTQWHPNAQVFQLRTNRNPRRTLLEGTQDDKGRWQYTSELSQTGQTYIDKIKTSIVNSDRKCGFIGHKTIIENHTADIDAATGHFGGLVGLNEHFFRDEDDGILLHILGTPNIGQEALETACKLLIGMTDSPLNFTRNDDGTYDDQNVQTIADAIIQDEMTQGCGRGGLVKNPSKIVIWSSYELPSITHRGQTILFDETDWENAVGDLDALAEVVAQREAHEKAVADAIEKGDTRAVAELKGVSERHARRITQEPRQKNTAKEITDRNAKVIELHKQGVNKSQIHRETGVPRSTVIDIIKHFERGDGRGHGHVLLTHVDVRNRHPHEKPDDTYIPSVLPEKDPKAYKNGHGHVYIPHADVRSCTPPKNLDETCVERETLDTDEVAHDHDTFFKLLDIETCFYGKKQRSASDISQLTGIPENEVRQILNDWYQAVVISPGVGDKYWMSESDTEKLWAKILGSAFDEWVENFPGQKILCPPGYFNPHLNAATSNT